jgi:hypothetical protein
MAITSSLDYFSRIYKNYNVMFFFLVPHNIANFGFIFLMPYLAKKFTNSTRIIFAMSFMGILISFLVIVPVIIDN